MPFLSSWRELGSGLAELFFEAHCALCGAPSSEASPWLCAEHGLSELRLLRPTCALCALPCGETERPCERCREEPPPWVACAAALAYAGSGRELLLQAKLGRKQQSLRPLASELAAELERHAWAEGARFVPVPLHRERRSQRGFNQAEVIARELAERFGGRVLPLLRRTRATSPQGDPLTVDRAANVRAAFALRRLARVPGELVLVDDTSTSMATLRSCAAVLGREGCRVLRAAVVFRAGGAATLNHAPTPSGVGPSNHAPAPSGDGPSIHGSSTVR